MDIGGVAAEVADNRHRALAALARDVGDHDFGAFPGKPGGCRPPDAGSAAGDECNLALEPAHLDYARVEMMSFAFSRVGGIRPNPAALHAALAGLLCCAGFSAHGRFPRSRRRLVSGDRSFD